MNRIIQVTDYLLAEILPDDTIRWIELLRLPKPKKPKKYEPLEPPKPVDRSPGRSNREPLPERVNLEDEVERLIIFMEDANDRTG